MPRIARQRLTDFGIEVLTARGVAGDTAALLADTAVDTEAMGIHTHGVVLFAHWDKTIGNGLDPAAEPEIVAERPATALIDGHSGFGPLSARLAREIALDKAKACGVAMVAARNLGWLGALAPHILPISQAGYFAQMWAQASSCRDCAPWGGLDPCFSTNPISITFPTGGLPMLSDFSSAAISMGRTDALIHAGERVPENLYLDMHGTPTTDPAVMRDGGSMMFTGGERYGYRGYAFALWAEALAALAGGRANNPDLPYRQHFGLVVIDPDAFGGHEHYYREMARFLDRLRASRLRPGFTAIRLPGERAQHAAQEAESEGVAVPDETLALLNRVAERHGLELRF